MSDRRLQLAFGGLHPDRLRSLCAEYGTEGTWRRLTGGKVKTTARVREAVRVPAAERRDQLHAAGIQTVTSGSDGYPGFLAEMPDAPDLLFVRGSLPKVPGVAVVGTRRCTSYGRRIAWEYGQAIAEAGWTLVSGLARGIDGAAHTGTVEAGGVGVAVLGSGIDVMYPREHAALAQGILDGGGAVVSESPPGTPPEAWRFPPRNRIISGLSRVVVVVEATIKGGALITAEAALRHGRQVFAVPGDIQRASSAGCNLLIRDGAFPVHGNADLIESLELVLGPATGPQPSAVEELSESESETLRRVRDGVDSVDELVAADGGTAGDVLAVLGRLEMLGLVHGDGAGSYHPVGGR